MMDIDFLPSHLILLGGSYRIPVRLPRALAHGAEIMFGVLVGILRLDLIAS